MQFIRSPLYKWNGLSGLVISKRKSFGYADVQGARYWNSSIQSVGWVFFWRQSRHRDTAHDSFLAYHPRFRQENLDKNIYRWLENLAKNKKHVCSPAQLALAWVLGQVDDVVPIPGTTKIKNLDGNIGSLRLKLTEEHLKEISDAVPVSEVAGGRSYEFMEHVTWKFANTPPKA